MSGSREHSATLKILTDIFKVENLFYFSTISRSRQTKRILHFIEDCKDDSVVIERFYSSSLIESNG